MSQPNKRPHGQLRHSQVITTFGPGSLVDLPTQSAIVGGLEHWFQVTDEVHEPRLIVCDEPTAALDLEHQHRVLKLARHWARTQGIGVVTVLHDLNLALRYSDNCIVLQQGRLAGNGLTAEVLSPALIKAVWNMAAWPVSLPISGAGVAQDEAGVSLQYVFGALG